MANNDIHFIRKELDRLQTKVANFDVTTEYAQSTSDTTAPTHGWSTTKPAPTEGYFVWARNIMNMGYGDIISEPYCIGDGLEHILSIDVEYIAWSDAYQSPPQSSEYWQTTAPSIQSGQYIWTRTKMVTTYGTNYTDPVRVTGIDGQNGQDGRDGVSIKGDDGKGFDFIYYTTGSANFNTTPEDNVVRTQNQYNHWCDSPTPVDATHQYIYMSLRTTDNNGDWGHWSSPVLMSSIGEKGEDGEGFEIVFTRTNSDSTVPTFSNGQGSSSYTGTDSQGRHYQDADFTPTGWTDNQQGVDSNNKYEWASFRFKTVTNGEASWGNFNTPKIWATFSEDGESSYIHIRYADTNNPSNANQVYTSPHRYIGIYVDNIAETNANKSTYDNPSLYSWSLFKPEEGIDFDGKFLHMKYASDVTFNQDGSVNTVTFTGNNGEDAGEWLGTLFDYTVTDSTNGADYTWTKIEGNGISNIQEQYAMSTSYTTAPTTGWSNSPLENEVGKFYWTRNVISFTDGTTTTTNAICVSGADGDGVHNAYYCTDSLSTPNTPSFSDIHANSSTASQNYDKWVEDPVAIDSTHRYIYISTSTSYSYVNGVKTWNSFSEPVLWSRYALDGSDGADGSNGTNGTNGIGYEYAYYTSNSSTAPTKPSGNVTATSGTKKWTTVPIPMTSTYKYMYISYRTVQGSTKSTWSDSALWSQFGEKGDTGASGKDGLGMEHIFYLTNTEITDWDSVTGDTNPTNWTTQPTTDDYVKSDTGWSDDATGVDSTHKYEYCSIRRKEYDTDGKTAKWGAFSTPSLWAKFGEKGDKGDKGDTGDAGQGFEYVYKLNANDTTPTTPSGNITNTSTRGNWAKLPLDMGADYPYTFISYRTSDENGDWGSWTTPSLWSRLGEDGYGVYSLDSDYEPTYYHSTSSGIEYFYRRAKTDVDAHTNADSLRVGDFLVCGDYMYQIVIIGTNNYGFADRTLLKGEQGVKGADGLGLEHIFCRTDKNGYIMTNEGSRLKRSNADVLLSSSTNSNPRRWTAQTTTDDYYDTSWGWYDNAQGVTEDIPYEYVAIRKKTYDDDGKTAIWGIFTDYKLWAKYGESGASIVFAYYTTSNENYSGSPTGSLATGNDKNHDTWCDTPYPTSADYPLLYVSTKTTASSSSWSTASLMSRYGLDGSSGSNGTGYEYAYYTTSGTPNPAIPDTVLTTGVVDSWQKTPVAMTDSATKIYISYRTKTGSTYTGWSTGALFSVKGDTGDTGSAGADGSMIYEISATPTSRTTSNPLVKYRISWNDVTESIDFDDLKEGDIIKSGTYLYPFISKTASQYNFVYFGERTDLQGEQGVKGYDGVGFEMIFKLMDSESPTWSSSNNPATLDTTTSAFQTRGYVPTGWTDDPSGVSLTHPYEFASVRTSDENGVWSAFSTPSLFAKFGDDGIGIEYIYCVNDSTTAPTFTNGQNSASFTGYVTRNGVRYYYQDDDFVPSGWSDDPISVSENNKYCWVSQRSKVNGVWGDFGNPTIWAKYGETGDKGDTGERGTRIIEITKAPTYNSSGYSYGTFTYYYRKSIKEVLDESGETKIKLGDYLKYDTTLFLIEGSTATMVYLVETELAPDMDNIDASLLDGKESTEFMTSIPDIDSISQTNGGVVECWKFGQLILTQVRQCNITYTSQDSSRGWEKLKQDSSTNITLQSAFRPSNGIIVGCGTQGTNTKDTQLRLGSDGTLEFKRAGFGNGAIGDTETIDATFIYFHDTRTATTLTDLHEYGVGNNANACIGDYLEVQLKTGNTILSGYPIVFRINSVNYQRTTDSNGVARLLLNLPKNTAYTWSAKFNGDTTYKSSTAGQTNMMQYACGGTLSIDNADHSTIYRDTPFSGTLLNSHQNPVMGATVTVTVEETISFSSVTDENGMFRIYHPNDGIVYQNNEWYCSFTTDTVKTSTITGSRYLVFRD